MQDQFFSRRIAVSLSGKTSSSNGARLWEGGNAIKVALFFVCSDGGVLQKNGSGRKTLDGWIVIRCKNVGERWVFRWPDR